MPDQVAVDEAEAQKKQPWIFEIIARKLMDYKDDAVAFAENYGGPISFAFKIYDFLQNQNEPTMAELFEEQANLLRQIIDVALFEQRVQVCKEKLAIIQEECDVFMTDHSSHVKARREA